MSVAPSFKRPLQRIRLGLAANSFGIVVRLGIQILQVPIFLMFWGVDRYGEWILLFSIPAYIALSDLGMSAAGTNLLCREVARNNYDRARTIYWAIWTFTTLTSLALGIAVFIGVAQTADSHFGFKHIVGTEFRATLIWLCLSVVIRMQIGVLWSAYTSLGRYGEATFIDSLTQLLELAVMTIILALARDAGSVALGLVGVRLSSLFYSLGRVAKAANWVCKPRFVGILPEIHVLFVPAMMLMVFPLGNALGMQGIDILVGTSLGGTALVGFTTTRTFVRLIDQGVNIAFRIVQPEAAFATGSGDDAHMRLINRLVTKISIIVALTGAIVVITIGSPIYEAWTLNRFAPDYPLILLFMLGAIIRSSWYPSAAIVTAQNKHASYSLVFLVATGLSFGVAALAVKEHSIFFVAGAMVLPDLILCAFVPLRALRLTGDNLRSFMGSFFSKDDYIYIFYAAKRLCGLSKTMSP
jgi:O-antigen/teichoic acid export membrane protein